MDKRDQALTKLNSQEVRFENFLALESLKKMMRSKRCTVLLDIDETIITPLYIWTDYIKCSIFSANFEMSFIPGRACISDFRSEISF